MCRALRNLLSFFLLAVVLEGHAQNSISLAGILVSISGQGSVTISQPGLSDLICSPGSSQADCLSEYRPLNEGDTFTFTAAPDAGWSFTEWQSEGNFESANPVLTRGPLSTSVVLSESIRAVFVEDADGDGIPDLNDICPNTPAGELADASGCSDSQKDDDGDGVFNDADICPNTPFSESVNASGCSESQTDGDGDGVVNTDDACPNTPPGESVDASGCSDSQKDDDGDGVFNDADICPNTPFSESVDASGCSDSQKDGDLDGVTNDIDQCPDTPNGEAVDSEGCADSQKDTDSDGVTDDIDECPATPVDDDPNEVGCGASQRDTDEDGVNDALDLCPGTVAGEAVDADGCADTQKDTDSDGVNDALDQCPETPVGEDVDGNGCSEGQRDDDGDGVANAFDTCNASEAGKPVNDDGCTAVQEQLAAFGDDLADLDGLDEEDRTLAGAIDDVCPRLIIAGDEQTLSSGQEDLRLACINLKSSDSTSDQQLSALASISPQLLTNRNDAVIETASRQFQQITQRLSRIKSGSSRGVSLAGLTLNFAGEAVPGALLEEAADQAGASDLGPDFGNWGIYLQGDIDVTERRDTDSRRQYDEDAWLLTLGADYRFNPDLYAGLALSFGETETDYADAQSDSETTALTLYGGWQFSDAGFIDVQLGWADDDYDMSRQVGYQDAGGSFSSVYQGATGGKHVTAAANLGYMMNIQGWRLGPTASYFYLDGEVDGYQESAAEGSSEAWELAVGGSAFEKSILRLGLQVDYAWLTDFGVVIPGIILHYVSESNRGDAFTTTRLANDLEGFGQLIDIQRETLDGQYWDASFNIAGQFAYGFSGFASYRITAARDGYQHRGYTLGLRWDQAF